MQTLIFCLLSALGFFAIGAAVCLTVVVIGAALRLLVCLMPYVVAIGLSFLLWGCGSVSTDVHLEYHEFSDVQTMQLDCALAVIEDLPLYARGSVWLQPVDNTGIWGHTRGPSSALIIDLQDVPEMPFVFVHELLHVLSGQETGDRDAAHANAHYFGSGSLEESLGHAAMAFCAPQARRDHLYR